MSRKRKKGKAKPGTWVTREMLNSKAFWALSSTAKGMLFQFLLKRDMDKNHTLLNGNNITLTYKELEAIHGENLDGSPCGLARGSITRGFKDLLEKGFIKIVRQGGAYHKDKTIYGLTHEWEYWQPGAVIREKQPGKKAGYEALKKKSTTITGPIHTTITGP